MLSSALSTSQPTPRHVAVTSGWRSPQALTLDEQFARSPVRSLDAKEHVFAEGDTRTHLFRVESGAICLYKVMSDGRRQVLGFAYPGDLIGFGSLPEYKFNAQATKRAQLRLLSWSTVQQTARHDAALSLKLYEAISNELAAAHDLLLTTGQRSAAERVAAFLLAMSRRAKRSGQDANVIDLPMTRADIGDFLGLTIETVSRTFTKLRQQRIIDLAQSARVLLVDIVALEELAEGGNDL
jgi:CRP/FNR family transcriptional regulator, anaerobic regulatory protein